jgi:hypothetical protein
MTNLFVDTVLFFCILKLSVYKQQYILGHILIGLAVVFITEMYRTAMLEQCCCIYVASSMIRSFISNKIKIGQFLIPEKGHTGRSEDFKRSSLFTDQWQYGYKSVPTGTTIRDHDSHWDSRTCGSNS